MPKVMQMQTQGPAADVLAQSFVIDFRAPGGDDTLYPGVRYASEVLLTGGETPSYGFGGIPINNYGDELAPSLALVKKGFAGKVPPRSRAKFAFSDFGQANTPSIDVLCGTLVRYGHNIYEDSLIAEIYDDRWLMSKVTVFGRAVWDPSAGSYGAHYFDAGAPLIFNLNGIPDCLDTAWGPRFPPSFRYGWKSTDYEEPGLNSAQKRCRSWTCADMISYLYGMYYANGYDIRPPQLWDYGKNILSHFINWPSDAAGIFGSTANALRVGRHVDIEGKTLLDAMTVIIRKAGPYDLYMECEGWNSRLTFKNMNPPGSAGTGSGNIVALPSYFPGADVGTLVNSSEVIHSGYVNESIIRYFDDVCILGDPSAIERTVTTVQTNAMPYDGLPSESIKGLMPAWDRGLDTNGNPIPIGTAPAKGSDEYNFLDYIQHNPDHPNLLLAFREARDEWPDVFVAYQIPGNYDVWVNTKWDPSPPTGTSPRLRPTLLSSENIAGDSGSQDTSNPRDWQSKEVQIYYENAEASGVFLRAHKEDNFRLSPDGRIMRLSSLADANNPPQSWRNNSGDTYYVGDPMNTAVDTTNMKPRHIKLSVAIESNWKITGRAQGDPNGVGSRMAGGDTFTYTSVSKDLDYVDWLRRQSDWTPDKVNPGDELFSDRHNVASGRLPTHSKIRLKDVKRIEYTGEIVLQGLRIGYKPGQAVSIEGTGTIPTFSVIKTVKFRNIEPQETVLDLATQDSGTIYDVPTPPPTRAQVSQQPGKPTEKGDSYKNQTAKTVGENYDYKGFRGVATGALGAAGSEGTEGMAGSTNASGSIRQGAAMSAFKSEADYVPRERERAKSTRMGGDMSALPGENAFAQKDHSTAKSGGTDSSFVNRERAARFERQQAPVEAEHARAASMRAANEAALGTQHRAEQSRNASAMDRSAERANVAQEHNRALGVQNKIAAYRKSKQGSSATTPAAQNIVRQAAQARRDPSLGKDIED